MSNESNEVFENDKHVVKIPIEVIQKIVLSAQSSPISEECDSDCNVRNALHRLGYKWGVIYQGPDECLYTAGFAEYDDCAEFVANNYGTDTKILYVLRDGVPRKNVKVQVKARL